MLLTKQLLTFRPSKADLIFACKTFIAAMLSLYIAFSLDLAYPMWAIGTVLIIASPYSGMVSSKCLYRLLGTAIGAGLALFFTPFLINTPWLFTAVLALWTGFCLYISMLDRTPRSYLFMLAGYTSVMVVCNAVNSIETTSIWDIALGRVLEISIAVICSAVVSATIFPVHLGTVLQQRVEKALNDTRDVFDQIFQQPHASNYTELLSAINRDSNDIHGLAVHLSYEKGDLKGMTKPLQEMLHQFSLVLLNLVAISQRLNQLDQLEPALRQALLPLHDQTVGFLQQTPDLNLHRTDLLPHDFDAQFSQIINQASSTSAKVVLESLKMDMRHFIQNVYTVKCIWYLIQHGEKKLPEFITPLTTKYPSLHRDTGMAERGALAAMLAIFTSFGLWIYSGWQAGYMMAQLAAVSACILTAMDNPVPALKLFVRASIYASIMVLIYVFVIFPEVKAFWQLAVVLAPAIIYSVCLYPHPPLSGLGIPFTINLIMALNLQNHYQMSAIPLIDASLAGIAGPVIAILALYFIRSISPDTSAKRLLSAHFQAMRETIYLPFGTAFKIHLRGMLDRIGILNSKIVESTDLKKAMNDALIETSTSIDLARLDELAKHQNMPLAVTQQIRQLQSLFDQEFQQQEKNIEVQIDESPLILNCLTTLQDLSSQINDQMLQQRLWISLNNIRYSFCHSAPAIPTPNSMAMGNGI
ncbi:MAG: FUSC family protein [Acinetobacter populi]|uniref:FUSC family protein n=1 Tax=Acinetobacter populi TaxID=1582270 RepID=UPI0023523ED1|nr:FUSC family protein [Acinetobacter populi]MCH4246409.1 FUSC family protein [Acinetobacter populi]